MILGSSTENPSGSGPAGIRIRGYSWPARGLRLASALELASLADSAGDGTIGDTIGITTTFVSTITTTSPTAECSQIATSSVTPADFTELADFMADKPEDSPAASMDLRHHTASLEFIPAHSAALIMAESPEASRLAGSRASVEVSTAVEVSMEAAAFTEAVVTANAAQLFPMHLMTWTGKSCVRTI